MGRAVAQLGRFQAELMELHEEYYDKEEEGDGVEVLRVVQFMELSNGKLVATGKEYYDPDEESGKEMLPCDMANLSCIVLGTMLLAEERRELEE